MSDLLRDAIVDAKALREAALKNAETAVIDKYSDEVRTAMAALLEQEEPDLDLGLGGEADLGGLDLEEPAPPAGVEEVAPTGDGEVVAEDIPLAATDDFSELDGENLSGLPNTGEPVEVDINLDALQEAVQQLQGEQEINITEEDLAELLSTDDEDEVIEEENLEEDDGGIASALETETSSDEFEDSAEGGLGESFEMSDDIIDSIVEELTVDMGASLSGWAGRSSESMKWEMEKALAQRRSTDMQDELETLKKAQEELVFENNQLKESLKQHKQAVTELKEATQHVNLSNARLLYTNRVLRNTSLNERQKTKIADAISRAGSVTEAKMIHQTLETTVGSSPKREPKSLSEAIGRHRTSVMRASRKESTSSDPISDRMKRLAGIK
tara:strand:+ start:96 stop:1250 length:1155 start_codon:yes stop_codon:yes gene_type:complete